MRPDRSRTIRARARSARAATRGGIVGWSWLVAMLVLLAACSPLDGPVTATPDDSGGAQDQGDAQDEDEAQEDDATQDDETDGDGPDGPGEPSPACPSPVLADIERTIGSQLDAFADGDVAGALSYASEAFRARIDVASFERLITDAYPAVADPESFSIRGCRSQPGSAQVLVDVVGADGGGVSLVYAMVEEAGRWAIDGASELATDPGMVA